MKKIACLLAVLYIGGFGLVPTVSAFDYDRIVSEVSVQSSAVLATITANLEEQIVSLPQETYGRFTLSNPKIDVGDMTINIEVVAQETEKPLKLHISRTDKENRDVDVQHWAQNPIQLKTENGEGETLVEVDGVKESTSFRVLELVWTDTEGEVHNEFIGKIY